jgi:hypothetical protein
MSSFLGRKDLSRGIRNNNPGNLIITNETWKGKISKKLNTDGRFEQFTDIKFGIRAMLRDLIHDIDKGKNTIRKLISEYAPKSENNTELYIQSVCKALSLAPDEQIKNVDSLFLVTLARSIIKYENGTDAGLVLNSHIQDAIDMIGDFNLKNVVVSAKNKFKLSSLIIPVVLFFYTVYTVTV